MEELVPQKGRKIPPELRDFSRDSRFQKLFECASDAIGYVDLSGKFLEINDAYTKLTGYSREELLGGFTYAMLTPPEYFDLEAPPPVALEERIRLRVGTSADAREAPE